MKRVGGTRVLSRTFFGPARYGNKKKKKQLCVTENGHGLTDVMQQRTKLDKSASLSLSIRLSLIGVVHFRLLSCPISTTLCV